ncbi:MAG: flagellar hook-length control protein FliK [Gammaproteobacteria bacterium]|nr:flagellar hook-length control protein FliK [Gammaproteobacteria bacterium]
MALSTFPETFGGRIQPMYVKGPDNNALLNLNNAGSSRMRAGWQVGQLLKAMVVSVDRQGTPTLEINGHRVQAQAQGQAQANQAMRAGQTLQLEVVRAGDQPLLRVLNPAANRGEVISRGARESLPQQQPLPQVLRALTQLADSANGENAQQLRALSRQILDQLPQLQQLRTGSAVKQAVEDSGSFLESRLRQLSQQGSTSPEAQAQLGRDLKAGLLRLLQAIRNLPQQSNPASTDRAAQGQGQTPQAQSTAQQAANPPAQGKSTAPPPPASGSGQSAQASSQAPQANTQAQRIVTTPQTGVENASRQTADTTAARPQTGTINTQTGTAATQPTSLGRSGVETTQQLESGLARIQFNQLSSIQQSDNQQRPSWLLEVPMRQSDGRVDTLQLEIQRDREGDGKDKRAIWTVSLSFDLKELGAVRAGLTLVGEKQVGINLWADEADTVALFQRNISQLKQSMIEAGLHVSRMGCQQGIPARAEPQKPFSGKGLVDVEA